MKQILTLTARYTFLSTAFVIGCISSSLATFSIDELDAITDQTVMRNVLNYMGGPQNLRNLQTIDNSILTHPTGNITADINTLDTRISAAHPTGVAEQTLNNVKGKIENGNNSDLETVLLKSFNKIKNGSVNDMLTEIINIVNFVNNGSNNDVSTVLSTLRAKIVPVANQDVDFNADITNVRLQVAAVIDQGASLTDDIQASQTLASTILNNHFIGGFNPTSPLLSMLNAISANW